MKRVIYQYLTNWARDSDHKSLILRGSRQVGKTHLVREFSKSFEYFVEANFEVNPKLKHIFEQNLDAHRIREALALEPILPHVFEPNRNRNF